MKLHRMPFLVQKMIIEEMGLDERLFLSTTSKRTCKLLGMFKINVKGIFIIVTSTQVAVEVGELHCAKWTFVITLEQWRPRSHLLIIDGSSFTHNPSSCFMWKYDGDELERKKNAGIVLSKLLRHLTSFLIIEKCLECNCYGLFQGLIPQLDFNYIYDKIDIQKSPQIEPVTPEELTFLLENVRSKLTRLNVKVPSIRGYKYQKNPEKERAIDRLEIQNHNWVDFTELPAARAVCIQNKMQLYQMNMVLESWIAGRNRDMEIGDFELGKFSNLNREIIFNDIETHATELSEAEIDSWFSSSNDLPRRQSHHNIIAVDILREIDGLRATVIEATELPNPRSKRRIFVLVWSEANLRTIGRTDD